MLGNDGADITQTRATISGLLRGMVVYHFHDTSKEARIKTAWNSDDNRNLKYDAANIAPFLLRLGEEKPKYYRRIVETIRQVAPFFDDFTLDSSYTRNVMLQWREFGSDAIFSAYQCSDGTLRAIALIAVLLQPNETLPAFVVIDEPELGLHPYAINIIAGLINAVSLTRQVLVATQSPLLLDQFPLNSIVVTERDKRQTSYRRLNADKLAGWRITLPVSCGRKMSLADGLRRGLAAKRCCDPVARPSGGTN